MDDLLRLTKILAVKIAVKMWQEKKGDEARKYALQREMECLTIDARRVLIAAAITDDPISFAELENILELPEDRLYFTLKELQTLFLFPKPRVVEGEQRFQINLNTKKLVRLVEKSSDLYARIERASKALAGKLPDVGQGIISSLVRQAYLRLNAGQHAEAEAILQDAIAKYPHATDLRGFLGLAYKRHGRISDARAQFDAASKLKGTKPEMFLQWIKMEITAREWSKAINVAERALKIHPKSYEIAECKAYAHRQAGFDFNRGLHHEKAEKMWAEAVEEVKRAIRGS
jgi:tetratricopeptide (TPR) repeat protein